MHAYLLIQKLIFDTWNRKKESEQNAWSQGLHVGMSPGEAISKESDTFLSLWKIQYYLVIITELELTSKPGIAEINIENKFKISFACCSH